MELTLKNYPTALSKDLQRQAAKTVVRECDEASKGHFVAYVDEGGETFDVSIDIAPKGEVTAHACDCRLGSGFCRHKAALLLHVAQGKKIKPARAAKKKLSKAEALLEEADADDLKAWVRELLLKNKDLELSFVQRFGAGQEAHTPAEAARLTNDAIKAVVGNKRNIDLTLLKKLVELWGGIHAPVVDGYKANLTEEPAFQAFHALLESCLAFQQKINTNSNRIPRYLEGLLQQTIEPLNELYREEAWDRAVGYFIPHLSDGRFGVRVHYLLHLKNLCDLSTEERRKALMGKLAAHYRKHRPDQFYNGDLYTRLLFGMVEGYGLFATYGDLFKPIHFDNGFNEILIRRLIDAGQLERAERYCREQILSNYREQYDLPYLQLLKEIYTAQNDEKNLLDVTGRLVPYTFQFEDFWYVYERMPEGEAKKKWRASLIDKAQGAAQSGHPDALEFWFRMMDHEQNYRKMLDNLEYYASYPLILRYFEPLVQVAKDRLLSILLRKRDRFGWGILHNGAWDEAAAFPGLLEAMLRHYTAGDIKAALQKEEKDRFYYGGSRFTEYLRMHLATAAL